MLFALWLCNLFFYTEYTHIARLVAVDILIAFVLLISGRIIPFFRFKALKDKKIENIQALEWVMSLLFILYTLSVFFRGFKA